MKCLLFQKRSVAENDGTVERNRKGKEVVMLDSDNEVGIRILVIDLRCR